MKVAVVGAGTAGLLSAMDLCVGLPSFAKITLIHSLSIGSLGVGESSLVNFPQSLSESIDYNHIFDRKELKSSTKYGVQFKNWRGNTFIPFSGGSHGIHFDASNLSDFVLPRLQNKYGNFHELKGVVESVVSDGAKVNIRVDEYDHKFDYVIDCRGYPENYEDYSQSSYVYLNSAIVVPSKTKANWEYTYHIAHKNGWMFGIPLGDRSGWGYLYNSDITERKEALKDLEQTLSDQKNTDGHFVDYDLDNIKEFSFENYYAKRIVNNDGNIFLNGNRALFFEPLQATSLGCYSFISQRIIDYIINDITLVDIKRTYNKVIEECLLFINLHYRYGSDFDTPFWRMAKEKSNELLNQQDMDTYDWRYLIDTLQLRDSTLSSHGEKGSVPRGHDAVETQDQLS
tara:strand:- start:444 stop:1640 length:1197 start_codon:yes stop_codon:yes gene_type:complete